MELPRVDLKTEEETLNSLLSDPHANANPSFQAFLDAKRTEIAFKKDMLSTECSSPLSPATAKLSTSYQLRNGPRSRYDRPYDPETVSASSVRSSLEAPGFSFSDRRKPSERLSSSHLYESRPKPVQTDALEWGQVTEMYQSADKRLLLVPQELKSPGNLSPREQHFLDMYQKEKEKAEKERKKARETVLSMREKLVEEKERHLEQMMELMRAHAGLVPTPETREATENASQKTTQKFSPHLLKSQPASAANSESKARYSGADSAGASNEDEDRYSYTRMISNDSEALRDEYEQNFECVLLEENMSERPSEGICSARPRLTQTEVIGIVLPKATNEPHKNSSGKMLGKPART